MSELTFSPDPADAAPVTTAIIPVGGFGTRMLPLTLDKSKSTLLLGDKSIIELAVEEAQAAGCTNIILICSPNDMESYRQHFGFEIADGLSQKINQKPALQAAVEGRKKMGAQLSFICQEETLGLGHAVFQAAELMEPGHTFAVILPDDFIAGGQTMSEMVESYRGGISVAALEVLPEQTHKYGIFKLAPNADPEAAAIRAVGMVEKPEANPPSNFAVMGRFILPEAIMGVLGFNVAHGRTGAGGEYQLTDAIDSLVREQQEPLYAARFSGQRFDCGDPKAYLEAQLYVTIQTLFPPEKAAHLLTQAFGTATGKAVGPQTEIAEVMPDEGCEPRVF